MKAMGLPLQPHVIVIIEDDQKIGSTESVVLAVLQSNVFYEMPTVMAAVDTCIKACFVMQLGYCAGARSAWLFIQKAIFGINLAIDDPGTKLLQLLADISK
jgi:hypothetical protein